MVRTKNQGEIERELARTRDRVATLIAQAKEKRRQAERASSRAEADPLWAAHKRLLDQAKRDVRQMERLIEKLK